MDTAPRPGDVQIHQTAPDRYVVGIGREVVLLTGQRVPVVKWFTASDSELRLLRGRTDELLEPVDQTERAS